MIPNFTTLPFKNDFMFCAVLHDNPDIAKRITEIITGRKITSITNLIQQNWVNTDPLLKTVRLDVTFEGDEQIYCVEMQVDTEREIERRMRCYQAAKDIEQLNAGQRYEELKSVMIIFICDYDPFGFGKQKYTYHNLCRETGEELDDGRDIIVVNTRGMKTEDPALNSLLEYIHTGKKNEEVLTSVIDEAADRIRYNKEWRERFMTVGEYIEREAKKRAVEIAQEMAAGIAQEMVAEILAGKSEEEKILSIMKAVSLLEKLNLPETQIAQMITEQYEITEEEYHRIRDHVQSGTH